MTAAAKHDVTQMVAIPEGVTRFEVIDHTHGEAEVHYIPDQPRSVVAHGVRVELALQDDGRTLKVFLTCGEGG